MAFATLEELQNRLDWELDENEERVAEAALEDASILACGIGIEWTDLNVPRLVKMLVLKACARYLRNPQGYTTSRAGDETVTWADKAGEDMGTVYFTHDEKRLIEGLAGKRNGFMSAPIAVWKTKATVDNGWRPIVGGGKDFPMMQMGGGPWPQ